MMFTNIRRLPRFLRFCLSGGVAFIVDNGLMECGVYAGLMPAVARLFSVTVALQVNYALQRSLTFHDTGQRGGRVWVRFLMSNALGVGVNYSIFLLGLSLLGDGFIERQLSVVAGTAVALVFNYLANIHFVFRGRA